MSYYGFSCYECYRSREWLYRYNRNIDPEAWLCEDCYRRHRDERREGIGAYVTSELRASEDESA